MKKLFAAFYILLRCTLPTQAQELFSAPDTVCVKQPVKLSTTIANGSSYYWGFCSGSVRQEPVTNALLPARAFGCIDILRDSNRYIGFAADRDSHHLYRLDYGNMLSNTPVVTDLGTLNNTIPKFPSGISLVQDTGRNWYIFLCGGLPNDTPTLARVDLKKNLFDPAPYSVNFGNLGVLTSPRGLDVAFNGTGYYGYTLDSGTNALIRLEIGPDISTTPQEVNLGNIGALSAPSDIALTREPDGNWYGLVTNRGNSTFTILSYGNDVSSAPTGVNYGNLSNNLFAPTGVAVTKDCGTTYASITNAASNTLALLEISFPSTIRVRTADPLLLNAPAALSSIIRQRDTLYTFVPNGAGDSTMARVVFPQCTDATIASSTLRNPPAYSYNNPGIYNVFLAINDGRNDMIAGCQQIVVLAQPKIFISNDTVLCQGDTATLMIQSPDAISYTFRPGASLTGTSGEMVRAFPQSNTTYYVTIPYPNGCIVDTPIQVRVNQVHADAGPDRTIADGSATVLGGPGTSVPGQGSNKYAYNWVPKSYLDNETLANPVAHPPGDFVYYLEVINLNDTLMCRDFDTVTVRTVCLDFNLPNVFTPQSSTDGSNRFGLTNNQVIQLNFFRIYDRWGKLVFSTTDKYQAWDGVYDGKLAEEGVYVWEADAFCSSGKRISRRGNVTLIR